MLPLPAVPAIALVAARAPAWLQHRAPGVVWCRTTAELVVLAQRGTLRAAVLDRQVPGVDAHLVSGLHRSCPVLVVGARGGSWWETAGATALAALPQDPAALEEAVCRAEAAHRGPLAASGGGALPGVLVVVVGAPGSCAAHVAEAAARSLARQVPPGRPAVLADLALDAPHRAVHRLGPHHPGLPELVASSRFASLTAADVTGALHPVPGAHRVLPGLRDHRDWVSVGQAAAAAVLTALRAHAGAVVAHVDRDLEGEADTGSFDIEDRNALARTAVAASDLVLVAGQRGRTGRPGTAAVLAALEAFGAAPDRTVVTAASPWWAPVGPGRRVAASLRSVLATTAARPTPAPEPQRIVPGTLGHWAQDIEGWITPSVPQQP